MAGAPARKEYTQIPGRSDSGRLSTESHQQLEHNVTPTENEVDPTMQQREPSIGYPASEVSRSGSYKEHRRSTDKEIKACQPTVGSPPPAQASPSPAPTFTATPAYSQLVQDQLQQMYLPQQFGSPSNNPAGLTKPTQFGSPYKNPGSVQQLLITSTPPANASTSPAQSSTATPAYFQPAQYQVLQMYVPQQFGSPYNNPAAGLTKPKEFGSPYNNRAGSTKPTKFGSPYNNPGSAKQQPFASPQPGPLYVRKVPMSPGKESVAPYMSPGPGFTPRRSNGIRSEAGTPAAWTSDEAVGCLSGCRGCFWRR